MNTTFSANYIQFALSPDDVQHAEQLAEEAAVERFRNKVRHHRATYDAYVGQDGNGQDLSNGTRRQIMRALRKSCAVLGVGQKSRIGRLGGGAAIGAIIAGFAPAAMAQYAAGGGTATGASSIAIGTGANTANINGVAIGASNVSTGDGAVALGNNNIVDTYAAPATITFNGILDRTTGAGSVAFPVGGTQLQPAGVGIGQSNTVDAGGIAIGTLNQSNNATFVTLAVGLGNQANGGFSTAIGVGNTSTASSTIALGVANVASSSTAIAVGRQNTASGQTSIALGNVATANQTNAIAIGHSTQATGTGAIAIGGGTNSASTNLDATAAKASSADAVAIGTNAQASGTGSLALGSASRANGVSSSAFGPSAQANADNASAFGSSSVAGGISSTAVGHSNTANGNFSTAIGMGSSTAVAATNSFAAGRTANAGGTSSVAIGHDVVASAADTVAIGHSSSAVGPGSVSIGLGQTSTGQGAVAIGDPNISNGAGAVAVGRNNVAAGNVAGTTAALGAVAIGDTNRAIGQGSVAIGRTSNAAAAGAVALGDTAVANNARDVALGSGSVSAAPHTGSFTINGGAVAAATSNGVVSVGATGSERQIQNVAAGVVSASSTDAINGSQLYLTELATNNLGDSIETITGGGLVLNPDGTIATNPSITSAGSTYNTITGAIQALNTANTTTNNGLASALGGGASVAANGAVTAPSYSVGGSTYNNVGSALNALQSGAPVQYSTAGAPTTPVGLTPTQNLTLVGAAAGPVTLNNVAAGALTAASNQAVNGAQINTLGASIATNTGGGSTFNTATGTVTAPTITVGGTAYSNLTSAIEAAGGGFNVTTGATGTGVANGTSVTNVASGSTATVTAGNNIITTQTGANIAVALNPVVAGLTSVAITGGPIISASGITGVAAGTLSATSTDAVNGSQLFATNTAVSNLANGTTGLVQQSPAAPSAGPITVGAATGGTIVNFANSSAVNRTLTGVAAGSTAAASVDAVNGGQLNTALASVATDLGGGASYNPVTGVVTAPGYSIDGTVYNNVGAALAALAADSKYVDFNSTLAAADATGTNASSVGPNAQAAGNNASAFGANADAAGNGSTAIGALASSVGTNATALGNGAAANGNNSVALGANSQAGTANAGWAGTSFAGVTQANNVTANGVVSVSGSSTNRQITGVADGAVNATSTDAISGSQLFNTATALDNKASNIGAGLVAGLGGGASVSANGTVTGPTYTVAGGTQNNVGAALDALNTANNTANAGLAAAIGGGAAVAANGAVTAPTVPVNGTSYSNLTDAISAAGAGFNFTTGATGTGVANGTSVAAIGAGETHTISAGNNIITTQSGNDVAIALNPALTGVASLAITGGPTINGAGITLAAGDVFDAGGNKLTNVAAGSTAAGSTDAVNGGQLNTGLASVATNLGGGSAFDPVTGTVTAPSITVGGTAYGNVTDAVEAGDAKADAGLQDVADALGGGSVYDPATGTISAPSFTIAGSTYYDAGTTFAAIDTKLTGLTNGTSGLVQQIGGAPGMGQITIGAATGGNSLSVAGTDGDRVVTGVAAGAVTASSTDTVNGAQIFANNGDIAGLLGGGAGVDPLTGALTAPTYTVGGASLGNVGAAIAALQSGAPVQYSTAGAPTTPNGLVPSQNMTLVGAAAGAVTLSNVGPAALSATSTDAVNGSQINILASSIASNTGGGSSFNPLTGVVSAPVINVGAIAYDNVTGAIEAGDAKADALGVSTASGLGSGSVYDPATGTVSAPAYTVAGGTQNNVGAALDALNTANNTANTGLADALGGGAGVAQDGTVTTPNYVLGGTSFNNVGSALTSLANGTTGLVQQVGGAPGTGLVTIGAATGSTALSVAGTDGNRAVSGVLAGNIAAGSSEAINGDQLFALAAALGTPVGPGGVVTAPTYTVNGNSYANVGGAVGAINTALTGGGIKYFHTNSTQSDSAPVGIDSVAIGPVSGAAGDRSISIGMNANAGGTQSIAIGTGNVVTGDNSGAIGDPNIITGSGSYALGNDNVIDANNAFAVGNNITIAAGNDGSVGLGNNTSVAAPNAGAYTINGGSVAATAPTSVVSVGSAGGERQITNVAAGVVSATSTDAVNGSQLYATANAVNNTGVSLGSLIGGGAAIAPNGTIAAAPAINVGGAVYDNATAAIEAGDIKASNIGAGLASSLGGGASVAADGTVTNPSYVVQGVTSNNVGAALTAVDGSITNLGNAITAINNGTSGLVQQSGGAPGSGAISVGAGTGGSSVNVAGTSGNRTITGVAAGAVSAASSDAVNGGQLFAVKTTADGALQRGGGTLAGSINAGGNSVTNLAGPVNAGDAANKGYVDGVAASAAATSSNIGNSVAANLGGGAAYNPATGTVSAPTYNVGGQAYQNVGAAIAATNMLAVQYVPNAAGAPTNAVRLGNGTGTVAVSNVAAGAVTAASTDAVNGGQLYAVKTTADGALQRSGGTMSGNLAMGGNRVTGLASPVDASDAATRGYVDAIQNQNVGSFNLLTSGLNSAFKGIERNSQGVALAIAMGGGFLSDDKDFSLWGAWGNFNGYNAAAMQTYIRLSDDAFLNAGISYGMEEHLVGTRVGFGIQF